jgi:hypothetical protein
MAFEDAARLGVQIAELALRYFGVFDEIAQARFRALDVERRHWRTKAFELQKTGRQS